MLPVIKSDLSSENFRFENLRVPHGLAKCIILKDFSEEIGGGISTGDFAFWILGNEVCRHLEDLR